jgi:hypothetical protein
MTLGSLCIFSTCKKIDTFSFDGYYSGSFTYKGQVQFDGLIIKENNYEEAASGGALNQKFPCLTKGTYKIKNNTITFVPSVMPDCLCFECLLNGEYKLIQNGKNIIFQKVTEDNLQIYNLTLVESSR